MIKKSLIGLTVFLLSNPLVSVVSAEENNTRFSDYIYGVCLNPVSGEAILNGYDCYAQ